MRRRGLLAAAALLAGSAGLLWAASPAPPVKAPTVPQRIVSINLCADQLVLALADRGQIAGLTKNAIDAEMSGEAAKAHGIPLLSNSAEQILAIEPDLIVGMPASRSAALRALPQQVQQPAAAMVAHRLRHHIALHPAGDLLLAAQPGHPVRRDGARHGGGRNGPRSCDPERRSGRRRRRCCRSP